MEQTTTIEWAAFRLAPGATEEALVAASAALQEHFLAAQPGFLRRELLRAGGGKYVDLVHWRDRGAAEAAMTAAMESPACSRYFGLMVGLDPANPNAGVEHLERLAGYGEAR